MVEPVVDHEGNSYERSAILEWLSTNPTSPITRNPLRLDQLTPNRALAQLLSDQELLIDSNISVNALYQNDGTCLLQVKVNDEETTVHEPSNIVCVIDVSYSMDDAAIMFNDSEGNSGLSLLDVVKHATRTVIESLGANDRLALVTYADRGHIDLPFTKMTTSNKAKVWKVVNNFRTRGSTNLWDGLVKAMEMVRADGEPANILLLTDGLPNIHPPRGELESLIRYKEKYPAMPASVSMFGFGYNLESKLLRDMAVEGGGHYCFIPDSSFVGTVFINAAANILSTAQPSCTLDIESCAPVQNISGLDGLETSWGLRVSLPPLIYGQTLDILVKVDDAKVMECPVSATLQTPGGRAIASCEDGELVSSSSARDKLHLAKARSRLIDTINLVQETISPPSVNGSLLGTVTATPETMARARAEIDKLCKEFALFGNSEKVQAVLQDVTGQISEAVSCDSWYRKWGRHYLFSLARAHALQQCTNFKDPGVQIYATKKFNVIRNECEEQFCKLPPPTASRAAQTRNYAPVRSMSRYYDCHAPCFAKGYVKLGDGRYVDVSQVVAGDKVATPSGPVAVACVVRTECDDGIEELVTLDGGVMVTPWHPVRSARDGTKWSFPADLASSGLHLCDFVYSFVLENGAPFMQIGPYHAVTLGHGITNDTVASHDYLGTDKVLKDLSGMEGWDNGLVCLAPNPCIRDTESHLIIAMKQAPRGRSTEVEDIMKAAYYTELQ